jgi:hypothetical protein
MGNAVSTGNHQGTSGKNHNAGSKILNFQNFQNFQNFEKFCKFVLGFWSSGTSGLRQFGRGHFFIFF